MAIVGCLDRRVALSNRLSLFVRQLTELVEEAFHSASVAPLVEAKTQGRVPKARVALGRDRIERALEALARE